MPKPEDSGAATGIATVEAAQSSADPSPPAEVAPVNTDGALPGKGRRKSSDAPPGDLAARGNLSGAGPPPLPGQVGYDALKDRFLLEPEVNAITGLSRTTRWREERVGRFPKRRKLSDGRIGWLASEVRAWMLAKIGGADDAHEAA